VWNGCTSVCTATKNGVKHQNEFAKSRAQNATKNSLPRQRSTSSEDSCYRNASICTPTQNGVRYRGEVAKFRAQTDVFAKNNASVCPPTKDGVKYRREVAKLRAQNDVFATNNSLPILSAKATAANNEWYGLSLNANGSCEACCLSVLTCCQSCRWKVLSESKSARLAPQQHQKDGGRRSKTSR
jgi:hypothetical protein